MKSMARTNSNLHRLEAEVAARVKTLFDRCPDLLGFSLHDFSASEHEVGAAAAAGGLKVEIGLASNLARVEHDEICDFVAAELDELLSEQPFALALLRDRTFARTLH